MVSSASDFSEKTVVLDLVTYAQAFECNGHKITSVKGRDRYGHMYIVNFFDAWAKKGLVLRKGYHIRFTGMRKEMTWNGVRMYTLNIGGSIPCPNEGFELA